MNFEPCWDCVHHQRTLVSTNAHRPLFYTSICAQDFDIRDHHHGCPAFQHAIVEPYLPLSARVTEESGLCL